MNNNNSEPHTETIAETDNFLAWKAEEPDGETTYHVELNNVNYRVPHNYLNLRFEFQPIAHAAQSSGSPRVERRGQKHSKSLITHEEHA